MKRKEALGLPISNNVSAASFEEWLADHIKNKFAGSVTFANPHSVHLARRNGKFLNYLMNHSLVLCDGIGLVIGVRMLGLSVCRLSFDATSLSPIVFSACEASNIPVILIGGKPGVAQRALVTLQRRYPNLVFHGAYSGFDTDREKGIISALDGNYRVVILGLGAPLQEEISIHLFDKGFNGLTFTCGGYLDQIGSNDKYYPRWVDRLNLRFLYRIFREPHRLWRRYLIEYQDFFRALLHSLIRRDT